MVSQGGYSRGRGGSKGLRGFVRALLSRRIGPMTVMDVLLFLVLLATAAGLVLMISLLSQPERPYLAQ